MSVAELAGRLTPWLDVAGETPRIVFSSRTRLARNLAEAPFPHRANDVERRTVLARIGEACEGTERLRGAPVWELGSLAEVERRVLVERHLASRALVASGGHRGVVVDAAEEVGLMVNEEDHLRIQSVVSGLNLTEALGRVVAVDRELDERLDYAGNRDYGYLTTCPTNVGTGLRASVLIHLPALAITGEVRRMHRAVSEMGMAVRGWFGEGSGTLGDFQQVSNQRTLGRTEEELCEDLTEVALRLEGFENEARERLGHSEGRRRRLEDRVHRAWGSLRSARLLPLEQVMACVSDVRLGKALGFLAEVPESLLNRLLLFSQRAHLEKRLGESLEGEELSWARAAWIRSELGAESPPAV